MANTALNRTSVAILTNKSGGALNYGDVVIGDTSNAEGFTTTTSSGYASTAVMVILEPNGIANNASGAVATGGWVPKLNLNTAATAWQWIKTHTVAGQGTPHSAPQVTGDFAIALDASATPAAILLGKPDVSGSGGSPGGSNTQVQYNNSSAFGGITGATTDGTTLTLVAPVLGTPASGTLTNCTGLPFTTGLLTVPGNICEGRLTTESGVPNSTSDRTAQGTIYWTPSSASGVAIGTGQITLYNGSALVTKAITELSLALTVTSGSNYDVFVNYNAGTPQLVLSSAWTNDTTRADALATQAGIVVKSGTTAYRWVGTIRASGANVVEDSLANRFVWNAYNQLPRPMKAAAETANSWTYTTATWRQANANTANQLNCVVGVAGAGVTSHLVAVCGTSGTGTGAASGIGLNSTTAPTSLMAELAHTGLGTNTVSYQPVVTLGYNYLAWLEYATGATGTFYGDNNAPTQLQSGIVGTIWN